MNRRPHEHGFGPLKRSAEHGFEPLKRSAEHGFTTRRRSAEHGFTLIEVMVALMIFGMIAAAGVAILAFSVRAQSATGERLDDAAALGRTMSILSADFAQAVPRATRDEGGGVQPAFVGDAGSATAPMLRLVRLGWTNIDAAGRAGAQKVAYRVDGGMLERIAYPMLDGAAPFPASAMLSRVREVRLRYRYRGAWSDRWDGAGGIALPDAAEVSIVRADGVIWRQLFLVGTGYGAMPGG
ncbi:MAG TPA: type II secretion system minor pseudopilin GspJ [Sphingomonas sp.]|nr:type II secretion system minor pseudopilin GspJ [Sphingomonas sp.]